MVDIAAASILKQEVNRKQIIKLSDNDGVREKLRVLTVH